MKNKMLAFDSSRKIITDAEKKTCKKCGAEKSIAEFGNRPESPDGHETRCKACHRERQAIIRAERRPNYFI